MRDFLRDLGRQRRAPLAATTIALYELPMQYPSTRWQQTLPAAIDADASAARDRQVWLARTVILLLETQVPLLTRELQERVMTRVDEFVEYRMTWDKFAQQAAPREEGGLLLAELETWIVPGRPPELRSRLRQRVSGRTAFTILATILDGFTTDTIRTMPPALQGWACLWLTYLVRWYGAGGPEALHGRASRHPSFFLPDGIPDASDFPGAE